MLVSSRDAENFCLGAASSSLIFSRSRSVTRRRNREFSSWSSAIRSPPPDRPIGLTRLVYRLRPRRRFAPPVQGHDTHTQRARNFALRFPLRCQIICLRQLRRDFHLRVPFLLSHSVLHSTSQIHLFDLLLNFAWSKRWLIRLGLGGCVGHR